jgi:hypothetical protein
MKVGPSAGGYTPREAVVKPAFLELAAVLATTLVAGGAHAQDGACVVELAGSDDGAWREAVAELERSLPREAEPADCARLRVELAEGGAELHFATRDGRSTRRALAGPAELAPTVQALRVSYGLPAAVAPRAELVDEADEEPPPAPEVAPAAPVSVAKKVDPRVPTRVAYSLLLGTRGSDTLHSPTVEGAVSLGVGLLDLGVLLRIEGHYSNADESARPPETSAAGLGINVGARLPAGPTALAVGGHIMLAAFHEEGNGDWVDTEGRVGAYLGVVAPRHTRTRLRLGVAGEVVTTVGDDKLNSEGTPVMPGWAVVLALGVEYGAP